MVLIFVLVEVLADYNNSRLKRVTLDLICVICMYQLYSMYSNSNGCMYLTVPYPL